MTDPWAFWLRALAGENPQSMVKGVPEFGFFLLRERTKKRTPKEDRTIGGSRDKITTLHHPVAIWEDEGGWHCVITRPDQTTHLTDPAEIDERVFSPCSRSPIDHETYLTKCKELESARERGMESSVDSAGLRDFESGQSSSPDPLPNNEGGQAA